MGENVRILLLEDSEDDAVLVIRELVRGGFSVEYERVETAEAFEAALAAGRWDAVIVDYVLPHFSGLEALRTTRSRGSDIPFIIVSGKVGEDVAVEAMREGANDYVLKSSLVRLAPAVAREIAEFDSRRGRSAAEALSRLQAAALDSAANAIVITDRDGTVSYVNPAFGTLTGYEETEASGKNLGDLVKSDVHDRAFYANLWETILAGRVWSGEIVNRRKNGRHYVEHQTITPVRDSSGEIGHFVAIKQDMTDQKQLEAQYLQSQKMETVGRLAGGIAHDFNNLLTVINGTVDLALGGLDADDSLHADLREVRRAGERAAALTRQLLAFGRRQVMQRELLDLNMIVSDIHSMLERLLGEDIDLVTRAADGLPPVLADANQIEQVIVNLVVNARDAMPDGGTLTIETHTVELAEDGGRSVLDVPAGPYVVLVVRDTGVGMDDAIRARVFEPFFTTKQSGAGTGLGLATVYGIVKQSDGGIRVDSEPGAGTTLTVYLPSAGEAAPQHRRSSSPAGTMRGSETVLVVDDEPALLTVVSRTLRLAGYDVLSAANGFEALDIVENHTGTVHLLLTDMAMPGMGGVELSRRLRSTRPGIKILFASGYADDASSDHADADLGFETAFIAKPFGVEELTRTVREVLDSAH